MDSSCVAKIVTKANPCLSAFRPLGAERSRKILIHFTLLFTYHTEARFQSRSYYKQNGYRKKRHSVQVESVGCSCPARLPNFSTGLVDPRWVVGPRYHGQTRNLSNLKSSRCHICCWEHSALHFSEWQLPFDGLMYNVLANLSPFPLTTKTHLGYTRKYFTHRFCLFPILLIWIPAEDGLVLTVTTKQNKQNKTQPRLLLWAWGMKLRKQYRYDDIFRWLEKRNPKKRLSG